MNWNELRAIFFVPKAPSTSTSMPERVGDAETSSGAPASPSTGDLDLAYIYQQKGISAPFTAEQALALLDSLPRGLRGETRRQALIDLLEEKDPTFPTMVAKDARNKVDALAAAADGFAGELADFITDARDDIVRMEEEIRDKQKAIEQAQAQGELFTKQCRAEAERLKSLLQVMTERLEGLR